MMRQCGWIINTQHI